MKLNNKFNLIAVSLIGLIILCGQISSMSLRKGEIELESEFDRRRGHKSHAGSHAKGPVIPSPTFNATNNTLSASLYNDLNKTFVKQNVVQFKINNRKWADNKMSDKQLEEIFLIFNNKKFAGVSDFRNSYALFIKNFNLKIQ